MNERPLVSIICLCYNHKVFVTDAVQSALNQTYSPIEIILVDDCSTDGSQELILELAKKYPEIKMMLLSENIGSNKAFNLGLKEAKGEYVIDLATDDVLLPNRVEAGVKSFLESDESVGVNYCNAILIDEHSNRIKEHYDVDENGVCRLPPPQGDLYQKLIQTYFISAPTMMMKKAVLDELGGYDESLTYEDFDFWIRSSRNFNYSFTDQVLVKRRRHNQSYSTTQYARKSPQMRSTFEVCKKIKKLNQSKMEDQALKKRIFYEMKQCVRYFNLPLFFDYCRLFISI